MGYRETETDDRKSWIDERERRMAESGGDIVSRKGSTENREGQIGERERRMGTHEATTGRNQGETQPRQHISFILHSWRLKCFECWGKLYPKFGSLYLIIYSWCIATLSLYYSWIITPSLYYSWIITPSRFKLYFPVCSELISEADVSLTGRTSFKVFHEE